MTRNWRHWIMQKTLQALTTAFVASAALMTSLPAQAQSMGAVMGGAGQQADRPIQQQREERRRDQRSGWYTTDGNSRSGRNFDNSVDRNARNWSQPRQNPNGYDQFQNYDPNEIYLPTQTSDRPVQCQTGTYGVRNPGFMAAVTVADAVSCRALVTSSGARDFIQVNDYGYEGRGVRQVQISLRGGQVTAVRLNGAQLPPQYGEALLDRPLAGIELDRTGMAGTQRPEVKSIRQWVGLGF